MANCRIQNIKPPCGYSPGGIANIRLLDYDDFKEFTFQSDGLYANCLVIGVSHTGTPVEVETPESAQYSSILQSGIYTHTVETFIPELSARMGSQLHLATKRRYVVLFTTKAGRQFVFGYEAGATLSYENQTAEGTGSMVTITAASAFPLFEVARVSCEWRNFVNIWEDVEPDVTCEWGNFVNIWAQGCVNAYSHAYSRAYNCTSPVGEPYLRITPASLRVEPTPPNEVESKVRSSENWTVN